MLSLRQQILAMIIGTVLILSLGYILTMGVWLKDRAELASVTKAQGDLATFEEIANLKYPGSWREENGTLYKGEEIITNNFDIVDKIHELTDDTCTIFLWDTRISTTLIKDNGGRAVGTKVSDEVVEQVLKNGNLYVGEAKVLSRTYQTAYKPIRNDKNNIIGMIYVGTPKDFYDEMYYGSLIRVALSGLLLAFVVSLAGLVYTQKVIIAPLKELTTGSQDFIQKGLMPKVNIKSKNEIGELANVFNQMSDKMDDIVNRLEKAAKLTTNNNTENTIGIQNLPIQNDTRLNTEPVTAVGGQPYTEDLPKGLNEVTLQHVMDYLAEKIGISLSADNVAEGIGLTRVTVRRYLDHLEKNAQLEVEFRYGSVGRPVKLYQLIKNKER